MSNKIPMDVLLDHAGSDYDDLPDDVKRMVDDAETDLANVGVDVKADLSATNDADELPTDAGPTSTSKPVTDNVAIPSFTSRGKARTYANSNGLRVIDNGADASSRWTVGPKSSTTAKAPVKRKARTAPAVAVKPGTKKTVDKKALAIQTYRALEGAGELKRSTFLAAMEIHGLGPKGASSYFYRIKGGTW
jgi:hypothetical protein